MADAEQKPQHFGKIKGRAKVASSGEGTLPACLGAGAVGGGGGQGQREGWRAPNTDPVPIPHSPPGGGPPPGLRAQGGHGPQKTSSVPMGSWVGGPGVPISHQLSGPGATRSGSPKCHWVSSIVGCALGLGAGRGLSGMPGLLQAWPHAWSPEPRSLGGPMDWHAGAHTHRDLLAEKGV